MQNSCRFLRLILVTCVGDHVTIGRNKLRNFIRKIAKVKMLLITFYKNFEKELAIVAINPSNSRNKYRLVKSTKAKEATRILNHLLA